MYYNLWTYCLRCSYDILEVKNMNILRIIKRIIEEISEAFEIYFVNEKEDSYGYIKDSFKFRKY